MNYLILGIIQGIFEWIPISSEGVLSLAATFLIKGVSPIDVALFLHLGTLFAVLVYFRKDWINILILKDIKTLKFLIITTVISLAVGYPLYNAIQGVVIGNSILFLVGFGLLGTAFVNKKKGILKIKEGKLALISGVLQGLAVIPGLSRSGSTIFGLSLGKENPTEILKLSYMMSVPVIAASSLYLFLKNPQLLADGWLALISAFIVGLISLHILIKISSKIDFFKFAIFFSILCFLGGIAGLII
jgi:undecaprenyl-diphosphatase